MLGKVHPDMLMIVLWDLIKTPLYKELNVTIHHQQTSLFTLLMDLEFQIFNYTDVSSNNFHFDSEELHCTLTYSMIHNFLGAPKIMDYENAVYFLLP